MSTPMQPTESADAQPGDLLLIATLPDEDAASGALARLMEAKAAHNLAVKASAVIRREDDGKINIKETGDVGVGTAAVAGGLLGGLLGMLVGRPAVGAGVGALLGAGAGKIVDAGINDKRLQEIGDGLTPGTSAVAAIVTLGSLQAASTVLQTLGATVTSEPIVSGATVEVPKTGNTQIDQWVAGASAAVTPYADQAAAAVAGAASSAEGLAGQVSEQAKQAMQVSAGEQKPPAA